MSQEELSPPVGNFEEIELDATITAEKNEGFNIDAKIKKYA